MAVPAHNGGLATAPSPPRIRDGVLQRLEKLRGYRLLPADWGGTGTVAITQEAVTVAEKILLDLPDHIPLPHPSPSADGEIGLTWYRGRDSLEAAVQPDGTLAWIIGIGGNVEPGAIVKPGDPAPTDAIMKALSSFYEQRGRSLP